jgi:MoxR-like ATPase
MTETNQTNQGNTTMTLNAKQQKFIDAMSNFGLLPNRYYSRSELNEVAQSIGMKYAPAWIVQDSSRRKQRGVFDIPEFQFQGAADVPRTEFDRAMQTPDPDQYGYEMDQADGTSFKCDQQGKPAPTPVMNAVMGMTAGERFSLVPDRMKDYVAWGHSHNVERIIGANLFAPIFITGMSGNGKTTMIEQACSKTKRECFRVNITSETDEDDLIGGFRLLAGETKFVYGPVVEAMQRGAVLLLDEIDLGSSKIMCLQPVLEGKGVFIKKTGEWITPAKGFTIVATANTKGKGDSDGRFIGTNVMNEAFLDRFDWTMEQQYAKRSVEKKILIKKMEKFGNVDEDFAEHLTSWAEITRKAFNEGAIDEIITTRRLENICKAFSIFKDRATSIDLALARFDNETQEAFRNLYDKVDESMSAGEEEGNSTVPFDCTDEDILDLDVKFEEKERVKPHGACWDTNIKKWTVSGKIYNANSAVFEEFNPKKRPSAADYALNA